MDSDDEIMSDSPSADELDLDDGTQDSEVGSIAGMFYAIIALEVLC
jgi:hypothetical protein